MISNAITRALTNPLADAIANTAPAQLPLLLLDYQNDQYIVNQQTMSFDAAHAFARETNGTYIDANRVVQTAPAHTPRFDHLYGTRALLIEPQSTNINIYSDDVNQYARSGIQSVVASATLPDESTDAYMITEAASSNTHNLVAETPNAVAGQTYAFSQVVKSVNMTDRYLTFRGLGNGSMQSVVVFDIQNGVIIDRGNLAEWPYADIIPLFDGWYWVSITSVASSGFPYQPTLVKHNGTVPDNTYVGSTDIQLLYGMLTAEIGDMPTSYIPTNGSAETRTADIISIDHSIPGTHSVRITYNDDSTELLTDQTIQPGWYPPLSNTRVKRVEII